MSHLTPALMVRAYAAGFFPMASSREDTELHWLSPEERGVLPLEMFHLSRRLRRTFCGGAFLLSVNTAFRDVVGSCATAHGTSWINHEIELLYGEMFDSGLAHSVEVWRLEGSGRILVGGLYGLSLGGVFFGESMFSRMRDASKVALVELVLRLRCGGYSLLDAQFHTAHLAQFGFVKVPRARYRMLLSAALRGTAEFPQDFSDEIRQQTLQIYRQSCG